MEYVGTKIGMCKFYTYLLIGTLPKIRVYSV